MVPNLFTQTIRNALVEAFRNNRLFGEMNTSYITLLYKENGKAQDNLNNYRPIAVLNSLYKILTQLPSLSMTTCTISSTRTSTASDPENYREMLSYFCNP